MPEAILTIIVPTYNRAGHLARLLAALRIELEGLHPLVELLVSDNASTDATQEVTAQAAGDWPALTVQRHDQNLGPEGNFLSCLPRVSTKYFWIMGDDDCPKPGVLAKLLTLLVEKQPTLLFLNSQWVEEIPAHEKNEIPRPLQFSKMSALPFSKATHVWVTFISGMIVNRETLRELVAENELGRFNNTSLVQLGWILPLLKSKGSFIYVHDQCILATKENSGGYKLLTVFGSNFTRIVNESFGLNHPIAQSLILGNLTHYLPHLIWASRNERSDSSFISENPWGELNRDLGAYWIYWLLLVPMGRLPFWIAKPIYLSWKIFNWSMKRIPTTN